MSIQQHIGTPAHRSGSRRVALPLIFLVSLLVAACEAPTTAPGATPSATGLARVTFQVYFSKHPDSDNDVTKVFPVQRTVIMGNIVSPGNLPAYAITQLIAGPTDSEKQAQYYTELAGALTGPSNCGGQDFTLTVNMHGTKPETGTATLQFCRAVPLPGDLSGPRIKFQIINTLMQFPQIKQVVVLNMSGNCFDDLSGKNTCLQPA